MYLASATISALPAICYFYDATFVISTQIVAADTEHYSKVDVSGSISIRSECSGCSFVQQT